MPEQKPGGGAAAGTAITRKQAEEARQRYQETIEAGGSVLWKGEALTDVSQLPTVEAIEEFAAGQEEQQRGLWPSPPRPTQPIAEPDRDQGGEVGDRSKK